MKSLLLCLGILTAGCAPTFQIRPQKVRNCTVSFEHEVSIRNFQLLMKSVDRHISSWQKDHGYQTYPIHINITHRFYIPVGKLRASGAYYAEENMIRVTAGDYQNAPSLYHELCHANFAPTDVDHEDERWDEWNERAREINWTLAEEYFE